MKNNAEKAAYAREYRKRNPDSARNTELKKSYGITLDQYNAILSAQGYICAICGAVEGSVGTGNNSNGRFCVDHIHDGGNLIRGLLCSRCNLGIGSFQDSIEILRKAAAYLEAHEERMLRLFGRK